MMRLVMKIDRGWHNITVFVPSWKFYYRLLNVTSILHGESSEHETSDR